MQIKSNISLIKDIEDVNSENENYLRVKIEESEGTYVEE